MKGYRQLSRATYFLQSKALKPFLFQLRSSSYKNVTLTSFKADYDKNIILRGCNDTDFIYHTLINLKI